MEEGTGGGGMIGVGNGGEGGLFMGARDRDDRVESVFVTRKEEPDGTSREGQKAKKIEKTGFFLRWVRCARRFSC